MKKRMDVFKSVTLFRIFTIKNAASRNERNIIL